MERDAALCQRGSQAVVGAKEERSLVEFPKGGGNLFVGNRFPRMMAFKSRLTTHRVGTEGPALTWLGRQFSSHLLVGWVAGWLV